MDDNFTKDELVNLTKTSKKIKEQEFLERCSKRLSFVKQHMKYSANKGENKTIIDFKFFLDFDQIEWIANKLKSEGYEVIIDSSVSLLEIRWC